MGHVIAEIFLDIGVCRESNGSSKAKDKGPEVGGILSCKEALRLLVANWIERMYSELYWTLVEGVA
jgi:hypothetical protein